MKREAEPVVERLRHFCSPSSAEASLFGGTMLKRLRLLVSTSLCLFAAVSVGQSQDKLPKLVQKHLAGMMKTCQEAGGKPAKSPGLLLVADLTGDGLADFVVDEGSFICEGAASLFSGTGGSQVSVYIGARDGQAVPAFSGGTSGVKVDKDAKPARLQLIVGGQLCGQKVTSKMSQAEYKSCWRPMVWNYSAKKLEYAPLSQIQPVR